MLTRLLRTTAFRLAAAYVVVFSALAVVAVLYVGQATRAILDDEVDREIEQEIELLRRQASDGNLARLAYIVETRSWRPGASLYLITNPLGEAIAGNVDWVDEALLTETEGVSRVISYTRLNQTGGAAPERTARVRVFQLGNGFRLLVGRDTGERAALEAALDNALKLVIAGVVVMATLTWIFFGRGVLRRVDRVAATSRAIAEGDLGQRLPIGKSGDEFDRLSSSMNQILDRLVQLRTGLQDVSENIAHDLKTPLTRMRNRLERIRSLPQASDGTVAEEADALIGECDQLIRIFDSLLMIARMQAGSAKVAMSDLDFSEVVRDVAELYEPVAQDAGFEFAAEIADGIRLHGNRELIGQAIANLIDNAIKYGASSDPHRKSRIGIDCDREKGLIVLNICDNGPGIPEPEHKRVLERFVRLEPSRGEKSGTGLGLSLVEAVAKLHGGAIGFSDAEPGLRARLTLPAAT